MDIRQKQYVVLDYSRASCDTAIAVIRITYNMDILKEKDIGDLDEAVRGAVLEYVKTQEGRDFLLNTLNGCFSWYNVPRVPKEIYSKYGILGVADLVDDNCERKNIGSTLVTDCDDDYLDLDDEWFSLNDCLY